VAGLFVSGAFGGVSPLGSTSSGSTDTGTSASVSSSTGSTSTTSAQTGSTVPYIVTFSGGTSSSDQTSEIAAAGATDVGDIAPLSMHSIDVPADSEAAVVAALQANANVAGVERDRSRETDAAPDDPGYADQWNLPLIGWDQIYGSVNPLGSSTIAVLDTGVSGSTGDLHLGAGWSAFGADPTQDTNGVGGWLERHIRRSFVHEVSAHAIAHALLPCTRSTAGLSSRCLTSGWAIRGASQIVVFAEGR